MRIDKAIRDFLIEIEIRKYTPKTIRSYRNNLSLFLRFARKSRNRVHRGYFFARYQAVCADAK